MPDLRGFGIRQVENELNHLGLRLGSEIRIFSDNIDPGKVIAHIPGPGEICMPDEFVKCLVSKGKKPLTYRMPDYIGSILTDVVSDLRLIADPFVQFVTDSNYKPGTILDQFPLPGYPVVKNQRIELTVATSSGAHNDKVKSVTVSLPVGILEKKVIVHELYNEDHLILYQEKAHPGTIIRLIKLIDEKSSIKIRYHCLPMTPEDDINAFHGR
jgi:hypothetical protein